jgi:hypothetical protein
MKQKQKLTALHAVCEPFAMQCLLTSGSKSLYLGKGLMHLYYETTTSKKMHCIAM